jgi:NAD(P)-dependent dehydrogenase (short-subunit alcohol dehydrogenase family)
VIVTGGSSGIGRATAGLMAREGCNVVIGGRDRARLERARVELARHGPVVAVGGVDVLVNSAGSFAATRFVDVTEQQPRGSIERNLIGTYRVTQAVVRRMVEQRRGGSIVSIGAPSSSSTASANSRHRRRSCRRAASTR